MDRDEFSSFYAAAFPRLVGQLYAMTGDRAEAQDAVQEAFVRAWVHHSQIGAGRGGEAWVRVTAWRIAASRWRRAREGIRLMLLAAQPDHAAGPGPDRVAFVEALRKVPAEQRRALVLYHLADLTVEQIAAETGVRPGTVKARLARGRAALRPYLRENGRTSTRVTGLGGISVPNLKDELRQLADDAARQARPLAVAEVIRQGDRRHRRTIIARRGGSPRAPGLAPRARPVGRRPGWVAPLAAAAAVTAVIAVVATVPGAIHGSGSAGPRPAASALYALYVAIFGPPAGRDGLIPISTATSKPGKPIHVRGMSAVAVTPDGKTIYAGAGDTVIPISTATSKPGRPIHFRAEVSAIAVTPDGKTAYVQAGPRVLVPVSTATNTPGRPIRVRITGRVIAFTPDGKTAYVGGSGTITPINTVTNTPGKPIRVGMIPDSIAFTPDGKTAYVVGFQGVRATAVPVSTATNTPGTPIHLPGGGGCTCFIAITPDGKTAYVTNDGVTPINTATNTPGKPIPVVFTNASPDEIAITPDGKTAYVASYGGGPDSVVPVSTATNTPGKPIRVGSGATIAITPDGKTLYAATMNKVVPVSTATNTPGKPIPLRGPVHGIEILITRSPATSG